MKSSLLVLSFVLPSLLLNLLMADTEPVLDSSGDEVRAGSSYYIVSVLHGHGGGLYAEPSSCPGDIFQESSDSSLGQEISFHPVNNTHGSGSTIVYTSTNLNINFGGQRCRKSPNAWTVDYYDNREDSWIITAYGSVGSRSSSLFKFEKVCSNDNAYQIFFDPPRGSRLPKSYVGITSGYKRRPALISVPPLRLKIVKASDALQAKEARLNKQAMIASAV